MAPFSKRSPCRRRARLDMEPLEERSLLSVFTVMNTNDSGAGSLRQAITDANASGVVSQIDFNIGSGGAQTIAIQSLLPNLGNSITIDGSTQPGYLTTPLITLTTQNPQACLPGLTLAGNGDTVRALKFTGFFAPPNTVVGGPAPPPYNGYDLLVSGNNNLILGNQLVEILGVTGSNNTSSGNTLGDVMVGQPPTAPAAAGDLFTGNTLGSDVTAANTTGLVIGGSTAGAGNTFPSGGITISNSSGAVVQGNTFTTSLNTATSAGVFLDDATSCLIGGTTTAERNVIYNGILIKSEASSATVLDDVVEGNFIGTPDGQNPPPAINQGTGIDILASGNTIMNNTIAFNGTNVSMLYNGAPVGYQVVNPGIAIAGGSGNRISQNSIFDNGITGIEFGYGVADAYKPNGANPGTGPNDSQNFPVITSAVESGGNTVIIGTLNSAANATYTLEFFAANDRDLGGYVEGKTYLGSQSVSTDAGGNASFTFTGPANAGPFYTATATDANGNTSEFWQPNRPAPTITSFQLSQLFFYSNVVGVSFSITGTNFSTTTTEQDNKGGSNQTEYISPTQFAVAANLKGFGDTLTFSLVNPGPAGGASNTVSFTLSANEMYVARLYETLLNRTADPSGLNYWNSQLDQGIPAARVVADIELSSEYRAIQVQALYKQFMHRAADPSGLAGGVSFLLAGGTVEQLAASLLGSAEYYQVFGGGTNIGFLGALYHDALARLVDPAGQAAWLQAFANGATAYQVAAAVLASMEYRQDLVDSYYQSYLVRQADSSGLASWVGMLNHGARDEAVVAGILGSAEYFNDATSLLFL